MRKILLVLFIILLILVSLSWYRNNPEVILKGLLQGGRIHPGQLHYRVSFFGILPVGEGVFYPEKIEKIKGEELYHLQAKAETLKIFSAFLKAEAYLDSYVDIKDLTPVSFRQQLFMTGKPDINKEVFYNQREGFMSIAGVRRQIFPPTHEPLSLMLNIRRMDFDKTKEFQMNINTNQKNYILTARAEPKDLRVGNKTYRAVIVKAQIRRRDKNPYHKTEITVVLLRDKENIPILVKVFASGALINARLLDIR